MGLFNFNRVYIPDFSDLAEPLTEALKEGLPGASPLEWTADMAEPFTLLKSALASFLLNDQNRSTFGPM